MATYLDQSQEVILLINSAATDLATIEVLESNTKSRNAAKKALSEAQIKLALLINSLK